MLMGFGTAPKVSPAKRPRQEELARESVSGQQTNHNRDGAAIEHRVLVANLVSELNEERKQNAKLQADIEQLRVSA